MSNLFITHGNPRFYTSLIEGVDQNETELRIPAEDFSAIAYDGRYFTQGDRYLILRSASNREIVKYSSQSTYLGEYLSVTRGQGGTTPKIWPKGTKIFCATTADFYERIIQAATNRTIDYNPNEVLAPLYAGEKVYQSGPASCERWWRSFNGTNPYWDLITGGPCAAETYKDIGWTFDLLIGASWEQYFDNTKWQPFGPYATWATDRWNPLYNADEYRLRIIPTGGWNYGYRPIKMRATTTPTSLTNVYLAVRRGSSWYDVLINRGPFSSGTEFDLFNSINDVNELVLFAAESFSLTNLEWQE